MSLIDLIDNSRTDKNTTHSYLSIYEVLFSKYKENAKNILEIGIAQGGSIKLWKDYFTNSTIYGIDIMNNKKIWNKLIHNNIILYTSQNAYDNQFVKTAFVDKNIKFDVIIDDGPHTLISMINFIKLYAPLLTDTGILIIEDIQSYEWIHKLSQEVPDNLKQYIHTYDLRKNKNRYDDILFVISKN